MKKPKEEIDPVIAAIAAGFLKPEQVKEKVKEMYFYAPVALKHYGEHFNFDEKLLMLRSATGGLPISFRQHSSCMAIIESLINDKSSNLIIFTINDLLTKGLSSDFEARYLEYLTVAYLKTNDVLSKKIDIIGKVSTLRGCGSQLVFRVEDEGRPHDTEYLDMYSCIDTSTATYETMLGIKDHWNIVDYKLKREKPSKKIVNDLCKKYPMSQILWMYLLSNIKRPSIKKKVIEELPNELGEFKKNELMKVYTPDESIEYAKKSGDYYLLKGWVVRCKKYAEVKDLFSYVKKESKSSPKDFFDAFYERAFPYLHQDKKLPLPLKDEAMLMFREYPTDRLIGGILTHYLNLSEEEILSLAEYEAYYENHRAFIKQENILALDHDSLERIMIVSQCDDLTKVLVENALVRPYFTEDKLCEILERKIKYHKGRNQEKNRSDFFASAIPMSLEKRFAYANSFDKYGSGHTWKRLAADIESGAVLV